MPAVDDLLIFLFKDRRTVAARMVEAGHSEEAIRAPGTMRGKLATQRPPD
jgi:hypothetical protein